MSWSLATDLVALGIYRSTAFDRFRAACQVQLEYRFEIRHSAGRDPRPRLSNPSTDRPLSPSDSVALVAHPVRILPGVAINFASAPAWLSWGPFTFLPSELPARLWLHRPGKFVCPRGDVTYLVLAVAEMIDRGLRVLFFRCSSGAFLCFSCRSSTSSIRAFLKRPAAVLRRNLDPTSHLPPAPLHLYP